MKIFFKILLVAFFSAAGLSVTFAQTDPAEEQTAQPEKSTVQQALEPALVKSKSTIQDKRREKQMDEIREMNKARTNPESEFKKPSPYNNESFTVTKFRESKTKKKLRKGEGRVRMSVPDPKGKPLKHKKKTKFRLFGN